MTLTELREQPGVGDLPPKAKMKFAAAIHFENKGDHEKTTGYLNKAVEHEAANE